MNQLIATRRGVEVRVGMLHKKLGFLAHF